MTDLLVLVLELSLGSFRARADGLGVVLHESP